VPLDLIAELEALLDAFEADGVHYALCGGLALAVHGHPRATKDIDVLVTADELDKAKTAAKRVGFDVPARKMIFGLRAGKSREVHRISKIEPATGELLALDLLVVSDELQTVWTTRETRTSRGRQLVVVSREGLATM
jgi:phosphopantetheine adenylyltransferase